MHSLTLHISLCYLLSNDINLFNDCILPRQINTDIWFGKYLKWYKYTVQFITNILAKMYSILDLSLAVQYAKSCNTFLNPTYINYIGTSIPISPPKLMVEDTLQLIKVKALRKYVQQYLRYVSVYYLTIITIRRETLLMIGWRFPTWMPLSFFCHAVTWESSHMKEFFYLHC